MCEEINRECIEAPVTISDVCIRDFGDTAVYAGNGCGGGGYGCGGMVGCGGIGGCGAGGC
jgi:hypothetical protein